MPVDLQLQVSALGHVGQQPERRPRLCFIVESGTDVRLIEGLAERFDLQVLARSIPGGVEISRPPATPVPITVASSSRVRFALIVCQFLGRKHSSIDKVVVQGYGLAALAANLAARAFGIRTTMLVCSSIERYYRCRKTHPLPHKEFRWCELLGLLTTARVNSILGQNYVVLSRHLGDVVRSHGARKSISVIPVYGVDTSLFAPSPQSKAVLKARQGLPPTGSLIFFSSRVAPEKDAETLLYAFRNLLDSGRDLWLLHRSGGFQSFLRDAHRFGVAHRVIATDAVDPCSKLSADYQASDLCVQASREEGLGFSPLEALACEVPVIAASVGGLKETVLDGQTGWTYPVGNSEALARCIQQVLDHPTEATRRAAAGRRLVIAKYERQMVFDLLAEVL
jgi:glycosyltransferase involved in cell wall biosynthesis